MTTGAPTPTDVELPGVSTLRRAKLSPEVAWWLLSRGHGIPVQPPRRTSRDPAGEPEALFDPGAVDAAAAAIAAAGHTPDEWELAYVIAPAFGWVRDVLPRRRKRVVGHVYLARRAHQGAAEALARAIGRASATLGPMTALVPGDIDDWRTLEDDGLPWAVAEGTDDALPKPVINHGTLRGYRYGCRCELCLSANNKQKQLERRLSRERERKEPSSRRGPVETAVRKALGSVESSPVSDLRREIAIAAAKVMDHSDPRYFKGAADTLRGVVADLVELQRSSAPPEEGEADGELDVVRDFLEEIRSSRGRRGGAATVDNPAQ